MPNEDNDNDKRRRTTTDDDGPSFDRVKDDNKTKTKNTTTTPVAKCTRIEIRRCSRRKNTMGKNIAIFLSAVGTHVQFLVRFVWIKE
jgi:hypothetical protein